jgi:hypothetical protein
MSTGKLCSWFLVSTAAVALSAMDASAAERTAEQQKNALEFKFEGIGFPITLEEFDRRFPDATQDSDQERRVKEAKLGLTRRFYTPKAATLVLLRFLDGQLMDIRIGYDVEKVNDLGGVDVLAKRLADKFGKADADSKFDSDKWEACFIWRFPEETSRLVVFEFDKKFAFVDVTNSRLFMKLLDRKKQGADTGF